MALPGSAPRGGRQLTGGRRPSPSTRLSTTWGAAAPWCTAEGEPTRGRCQGSARTGGPRPCPLGHMLFRRVCSHWPVWNAWQSLTPLRLVTNLPFCTWCTSSPCELPRGFLGGGGGAPALLGGPRFGAGSWAGPCPAGDACPRPPAALASLPSMLARDAVFARTNSAGSSNSYFQKSASSAAICQIRFQGRSGSYGWSRPRRLASS